MIRAIVLDDERVLRAGMCKILRENVPGLEVVADLADGIACLEFLETHAADLVISDIRMPHLDGLNLLRMLRERNAPIDFLFVSGYDDFEYCRAALQYGASDYILKPIDKDEFVRVVSKYVAGKEKLPAGEEPRQKDSAVVREIKRYLRAHYAERVTMEQLSENFFLNPNYISQLFKRETGASVTEYLTQIRMEMACAFLKGRENRVGDVAGMVGYTDPKQFSVAFKKQLGRTPSEYRRENM